MFAASYSSFVPSKQRTRLRATYASALNKNTKRKCAPASASKTFMPASVPIAPPPFRLPATGPLWGDALRFAIAPASRGSSLVLSQRTNRGYLYKLIHTNAAQYSESFASHHSGQCDKQPDRALAGATGKVAAPGLLYSATFLWRSNRNRPQWTGWRWAQSRANTSLRVIPCNREINSDFHP